MPKKSSKMVMLGRGGAPPAMRKGGRPKKVKMVLPKFGVGGDVGAQIGKHLGDWVQGLFGFKKGGRPRGRPRK